MKIFKNRQEAGLLLSEKLKEYKNKKDTIVIGLARGGIFVANEIATKLNLPLDVIAPRKIGAPLDPELAIGAITQNGQVILDQALVRAMGVERDYLVHEIEKERLEAQRRIDTYRAGRPELNLSDKTVILVDDGIATGLTIKAAVKTAKALKAKKIVIAVPVAPVSTVSELESQVDSVVCLEKTENFLAIGMFYESFPQTSDQEVVANLSIKH